MSNVDESITIRTDRFEHREVKPHFINPCCFGEDFATWLQAQLVPLRQRGFSWSEPIQEDYGWGFWVKDGGLHSYWVALSYVGEGPQEPPAEWVVTVSHSVVLNVFRYLFGKNAQGFAELRDGIWRVLSGTENIEIIQS